MNPFGSLSYNNKVIAPVVEPVDDLGALYKKKDDEYNYVLDTTNLLDSTLSKMPYAPKDKEQVNSAKDFLKNTIRGFTTQGDLENRVLDTKKLAKDLDTKFGLSAIQQDYQKNQEYQQELKKRLGKKPEDGGISMADYNRALAYTNRNNKAVQKDENGNFLPTFTGKDVLNNYNFSDRVAERLKGFKDNKVVLMSENGQQIVSDPAGSGYMIAGTNQSVSEEDLIQAAKSSLYTDPDFQDRVNEEVFYDLDRMLVNPDTGEKRSMTSQDLENALGTRVSKNITDKYNVSSIDQLQQKIESEGGDLESFYKNLKEEELANRAIQFGVSKESYNKFDAKYLKDWQLQDSINRDTPKDTVKNYGNVHTYKVKDNNANEVFKGSVKVYNETKENIKELEANLISAKRGVNEGTVGPQAVKALESQIAEQKRIANQVEANTTDIIGNSEQMTTMISDIVKNTSTNREVFGTTITTGNIPGLSINEKEVKDLIFSSLDNTISDDEYRKYIKLDKTDFIINLAKQELIGGLAKGDQYINSNTNLKALQTAIENGNIEGIYSQLYDRDKDAFEKRYNSGVTVAANQLKNKIKSASEEIDKKLETNDFNFTKQYEWVDLPPMSAEEKRTNPLSQLEHAATSIVEKDKNFYNALADVGTRLDVKTQLEEEGHDEVDWSTATLTPSLTMEQNPETGNYSPVMVLQVEVGDKDNKEWIKKSVFTGDEGYNEKAMESIMFQANRLRKKGNTLLPSERRQLNGLNKTIFNSTKYAKDLDLMNLNQMENKQIITVGVSDKHDAHIQAFKGESPQDLAFYLTNGDKDNTKYWADNINDGTRKLMTYEELANSNTYEALGGNDVESLKTKIANNINNSNVVNQSDVNVDLNNVVNLTEVFATDMVSDVIPYVDKSVEPAIRTMKMNFPNLIITDALRKSDVDYGSITSKHKGGKAIDLRLNADSKKLSQLPKEQLETIGIKNISEHNNNHIHVEFL